MGGDITLSKKEKERRLLDLKKLKLQVELEHKINMRWIIMGAALIFAVAIVSFVLNNTV